MAELKSALEAALARIGAKISANRETDMVERLFVSHSRRAHDLELDQETYYSLLANDSEYSDCVDENGDFDPAAAAKKAERRIGPLTRFISAEKRLKKAGEYLEKLNEKPQVIYPGHGGASRKTAYYASMWKLGPNGMRFDAPENAAGTTEHFEKQPVSFKAQYDASESHSDLPLFQSAVFPIATAEQAAEMRKEDRIEAFRQKLANRKRLMGQYRERPGLQSSQAPIEALNAQLLGQQEFGKFVGPPSRPSYLRQRIDEAQIRAHLKTHGKQTSPAFVRSGIGATDALANEDIVNRRLDMLDRLLAFRETTSRSGFGRYADAERASNEGIDRRNEANRNFLSAEDERRRSANENYRRDMMDDYEAGYHHFLDRYHGNASMAEEGYKKELRKHLPSFFRHSKASSKELHKMVQQFEAVRSIPVLGKFFGGNPITGGAALAAGGIKLLTSFTHQADTSNEKYVSWANAQNVYGVPSERFSKAAYLAGIKDPRKQAELYGKLTTQYGDAETILDAFGSSMSGMDSKQKTFFASALGLSPELVAMMDMYAGNLKPGENRKMNASAAMSEVARILMGTSDKSASEKIHAMFGSSSVGARLADLNFDVANKTSAAAARDMDYSSAQSPNANATTGSVDSHNIQQNITNNIVTSDTAEGIKSGVERGADEARAVMEVFDRKSR